MSTGVKLMNQALALPIGSAEEPKSSMKAEDAATIAMNKALKITAASSAVATQGLTLGNAAIQKVASEPKKVEIVAKLTLAQRAKAFFEKVKQIFSSAIAKFMSLFKKKEVEAKDLPSEKEMSDILGKSAEKLKDAQKKGENPLKRADDRLQAQIKAQNRKPLASEKGAKQLKELIDARKKEGAFTHEDPIKKADDQLKAQIEARNIKPLASEKGAKQLKQAIEARLKEGSTFTKATHGSMSPADVETLEKELSPGEEDARATLIGDIKSRNKALREDKKFAAQIQAEMKAALQKVKPHSDTQKSFKSAFDFMNDDEPTVEKPAQAQQVEVAASIVHTATPVIARANDVDLLTGSVISGEDIAPGLKPYYQVFEQAPVALHSLDLKKHLVDFEDLLEFVSKK